MNSIEEVLVRIFTKDGQRVSGVGFLIPNNRIVTCAHVVEQAGYSIEQGVVHNLENSELIEFDFPFWEGEKKFTARLAKFIRDNDFAGLEVQSNLNKDIEFPELINANIVDVYNDRVRTYGFPSGYENGYWVEGNIIGLNADGKWQIQNNIETGYSVLPGFSGAPVWDELQKGIIGIVAEYDKDRSVKTFFVIPTTLLQRFWDGQIATKLIPERKYLEEEIINKLSAARGVEKFVTPTIQIDRIKRKGDFIVSAWSAEFDNTLPESPMGKKIAYDGRELIRVLPNELNNLLSQFVLLGEPGIGKTTILYKMVVIAAQERLGDKTLPIPLYANLSAWAYPNTPNKKQNLNEFIQSNWFLAGDAIKMIESGEVSLFLDGVDEMGSFTLEAMKQIKEWLHSNHPPKRIVVACREGDYKPEIELGIQKVFIRNLEWDNIKQFVESYLGSKSHELLSRLETDKALADIAKNPYFLSAMIRIVDRGDSLPGSRSTLIDEILKNAWKRERLEEKHKADIPPSDELDNIFGRLAYKMFENNLPRDVADEWAISQITPIAELFKSEETLRLTSNILIAAKNAHLLVGERGKLRFQHTFLQEHFAAKFISRDLIARIPPIDIRNGKFEGYQWEPVIDLLFEIVLEGDVLPAILNVNPFLVLCLKDHKYHEITDLNKRKILDALLIKIETTSFIQPPLEYYLRVAKEVEMFLEDTEAEDFLTSLSSDFEGRIQERMAAICLLGEIGKSKSAQVLEELNQKYIKLIQEDDRQIREIRSLRNPKILEQILVKIGDAIGGIFGILGKGLKIVGKVALFLLEIAFGLYISGKIGGTLKGPLKDDAQTILKQMKPSKENMGMYGRAASSTYMSTKLMGENIGIENESYKSPPSDIDYLVQKKIAELGEQLDGVKKHKRSIISEYKKLRNHIQNAIVKIRQRTSTI